MLFGNKQLGMIEEADLQDLVTNKVSEKKDLEYKRELPGNSDGARKEFLADVSSFANASGGHIIYGIAEKEGIPTKVCGLHGINADKEIRRLESMIQTGIAPRIPGIATREVELQGSAVAIIIHIPRSWASPHMVIFKNWSRFFSRTSKGKDQLDVGQIKAAFLLSETAADRIRNFRLERLGKIMAGETPMPMPKNPKIVLHIIPFGAFDVAANINVSDLGRELGTLTLMNAAGRSSRFNFDGLLIYSASSTPAHTHTYLQVFRNGIFEAVEAELLGEMESERLIPSEYYETELLRVLPSYLSTQKRLGIEPPLLIMLSILGVHGYDMAVHPRLERFRRKPTSVDRDILVLPEILVETFESDPDKVMKPAFDAVWNAAGWAHSMNYNEQGEWVGQER